MRSCADVPTERFEGSLRISGRVRGEGGPVRAYVRLLDRGGEFVAELPAGADGGFTFFAVPGEWRLRIISAVATTDVPVTLVDEDAPFVELTLGTAAEAV